MYTFNPEEWERVKAFHGHVCPGIATGYRMAKAALEAIGYDDPEEGDLLVIAESERCAIDPFQIVLGCTVGKGKLYLRLTGKQAFTVGCRKTGKAIRVISHPHGYSEEENALRQIVMSGNATNEQYIAFKKEAQERIDYILAAPVEELMTITPVQVELPERIMVSNSQCCSVCGEQVMEPWMRVLNGKIVCKDCATKVE